MGRNASFLKLKETSSSFHASFKLFRSLTIRFLRSLGRIKVAKKRARTYLLFVTFYYIHKVFEVELSMDTHLEMKILEDYP
ncbi:hypothetical protein QVD17_08780 [Tagetes erecta]|uniref:Uncharacterized protein n=1 Tax=Tagetes erecta TaxID=13708 RepID=A0AAD8NXS2_TARER|nr:hypothetical protein QVD17_08780 [Tagetes erecta]